MLLTKNAAQVIARELARLPNHGYWTLELSETGDIMSTRLTETEEALKPEYNGQLLTINLNDEEA